MIRLRTKQDSMKTVECTGRETGKATVLHRIKLSAVAGYEFQPPAKPTTPISASLSIGIVLYLHFTVLQLGFLLQLFLDAERGH